MRSAAAAVAGAGRHRAAWCGERGGGELGRARPGGWTLTDLQRRLAAAELSAAENLARAERAEFRERAHQDKWAMEIDGLREQLRAQSKYAAQIRALQEQVLNLTVELQAAKTALRREAPGNS